MHHLICIVHAATQYVQICEDIICSLIPRLFPAVPRLFPPLASGRLQYAKTEVEGLGDLVTCVTSGRQRVDMTWGQSRPMLNVSLKLLDEIFKEGP